jgi:hypothetical protein
LTAAAIAPARNKACDLCPGSLHADQLLVATSL